MTPLMNATTCGGWAWWFAPLWILPWLAVAGLAIWLVAHGGWWPRPAGGDRAREILAERYARGGLSTEEYQERMDQLG
jgi:putative membrane protein